LANVEFRQGDATCTGLPGGGFDAVICVFGVFFAADMTAFTQEMWRLVAPGGVLAVTTWGPGLFEPAGNQFWECVREVEPSLYKAFDPWDEITTPQALAGLFSRAGVPHPAVVAAPRPASPGAPGQLLGCRARDRLSGYRRRAEPCAARSCARTPPERTAVAENHNLANRRRLRYGGKEHMRLCVTMELLWSHLFTRLSQFPGRSSGVGVQPDVRSGCGQVL